MMNNKIFLNIKNSRTIPAKKDPYKDIPEKAPGKIPNTEPAEDNPINPKEDEIKKINN
jgi:hypothetical protein